MERLRLTQVLKEGRALDGWSGERAFPGVAVRTPAPDESRGKSAFGRRNGCVRSPVQWGQQDRRKGKERRGIPGAFQRTQEQLPPSEVGEQPTPSPRRIPHGIREATGPPKSVRSGGLQSGLPTQQSRGLGQARSSPSLFHGMGTLTVAPSQDCGEE